MTLSASMDQNQPPLVSIIVITYNSAKYVLETLESAKAQTYQMVELIVSDDCSTDETVEVCRKWLDKNKDRFIRSELIESKKNTGIPANCNRGLYAAQGQWVKITAGDDILMPRCIEIFICAVQSNPDVYFFTCGIYRMEGETISEEIYATPSFLKQSAKKQFKLLAIFLNYISGPSVFMNKAVLERIDGYVEAYTGVEDFPLFIKITSAGYRFHLIDEPLVIYRVHSQSISHKSESNLLNHSIQMYLDKTLLPLLKKKGMFLLRRHYLLYNKLKNSATKGTRLKISYWMRFTDPYIWILKYHKIFHKRTPWNAPKIKNILQIKKSELIM